ncbi:hypothetical protein C8J57DRAFT_1465652 [Mycena rebaudengoi]|nr:hypothetical protein C8J57DRAFT_1465652 [Mycena rebaudengoi]
MRVPQEIVDAIIDRLSLIDSEDDEREVRVGALKACSLTCRSFLPRSQMHLLAAIQCSRRSHYNNLLLFDRLLVESPHIGPLYVRHFRLDGVPGDFPDEVVTDSILSTRILSLLPNLTRLDLVSASGARQTGFPTAVEGALSLMSLRTLHLSRLSFADASALDSLLSHARALQVLSLRSIFFHHHPVDRTGPSSRGVAVALASLQLRSVHKHEVDAMLAAFSAVDIRHLLSLEVRSMSSAGSLLAANAHTIQRVQFDFISDTVEGASEDPDILAGNTSLSSIEVIEPNGDMPNTLVAFGNLRHLTALKTISLHFNDGLDDFPLGTVRGGTLDAILAQAGDSLEDVRIYAFADKRRKSLPELAAVRSWLPSVAGRISIHFPSQMR